MLAAQRPNEERAIASTTKLMTAYAARRDLPLGKTVVAPAYTPSVAESLLGLEAGERIKVRDLLYGLLLVSGNDAAEALAQDAAGTEAAFVREMNRAAQQLGLEHTRYANPIGLDEAGNYSSAHDLVELAMRLRSDPFFRRVFDTAQTVIRSGAHPRSIVNRNTLVRTLPLGQRGEDRLHARRRLRAGRLGHPQGGDADLGGARRVERVRARRRLRAAARLRLLALSPALDHRRRTAARLTGAALPGHRPAARGGATGAARRSARASASRPGSRRPTRSRARSTRASASGARSSPSTASAAPPSRCSPPAPLREASLAQRVDAAIPGSRAAAWLLLIAVIAIVLIGAVAVVGRRRRR